MKCRLCGTEIAAKALICFRCGAPVEEAVSKPARLNKSWRPVAVYVYVVFVILVLTAVAVMLLRR